MCQFVNTVAFYPLKMVFQGTAIPSCVCIFRSQPHQFSRDISPNFTVETACVKNKSQIKSAKSHKF